MRLKLSFPNDERALIRRQNHPEMGIPDLIVYRWGKGQAALGFVDLELANSVIGIAKHPDRLIFPKVDRQATRLKIE